MRNKKNFKAGYFYKFQQKNRKDRLRDYPSIAKKEEEPMAVRFKGYADNLSEVGIKVDVTTNKRMFSDGEGDAIKKVFIEIDLSKTKLPWQPHCDQKEDFASAVSEMILNEYYDYASNIDY